MARIPAVLRKDHGGESGAGARPMRIEWLRGVGDQCVVQSIPLFMKQFGLARNNPLFNQAPAGISGAAWVARNDLIGKGGSTLDGREWKQYSTI